MTNLQTTDAAEGAFDPRNITRPDPTLMRYYLLVALCTGPLFPIVILPLLFKYETLKYRFDESGLSMSWGILFRREVYLTYRRIQDIHLTRNIIQRWMGLATVSIQTASGSATPEMSIEGILAADALRDYLYSQMRGAREESTESQTTESQSTVPQQYIRSTSTNPDEALALLHEIGGLLRQVVDRPALDADPNHPDASPPIAPVSQDITTGDSPNPNQENIR